MQPASTPRPPRDLSALWWSLAGVALVLGAGAIVFYVYRTAAPGTLGIAGELRDRGRIAVVGDDVDRLLRIEAEGAQLVDARQYPALDAALRGDDEDRLDDALGAAGLAGVLVAGRDGVTGTSLRARLSRYEHFDVLSGVYLTPGAALYVRRRGFRLDAEDGAILARAARQIVGGARLPNVRAFPEPLRRSRSVEVMVLLRQSGRARLWRSARGGSIARALITASSVARDRWDEREAAMGGSIDERLPGLTVEIYLLEEDGTLGDRSPAFLERVITPAHGVAFERHGAWHYLLPEQTAERGGGSAVRAYEALFEDASQRSNAFDRPDLRFYRIVARLAGTSAPSSRSAVAPLPSDAGSFAGPPGLEGLEGL